MGASVSAGDLDTPVSIAAAIYTLVAPKLECSIVKRMDTGKFKERLLAREKELQDNIARLVNDARESASAEVEDPIDQVVASEGKAAAFEVSTVESRMLQEVRAALQRIDAGTFGICIDCGREIEPARLEAVPWTPYCRADQEKHEGERAGESGLSY
jgi:DnaK suppressor protein